MSSLRETLTAYVSTAGPLGSADPDAVPAASRLANRAALLERLRADVGTSQQLLVVWIGAVAAVFTVLLAAMILRISTPYVTVPAGCGALLLLLSRVERVWREVHLQSLALQVALQCDDEKLLREVMTTILAGLLAQQRASPKVLPATEAR